MLPEFLTLDVADPSQSGALRLAVFATVLVVMGLLETAFPRRKRSFERPMRWFTNLGMVVISSIAIRLIFPSAAAIGVALWATANGYGLFGLVDWPFWLEALLTVILLDMAIYWQHVASHKIPVLWLVHRVHHADPDIDATTGVRFHPIEIVLSMVYKMLVVILLGGPAAAVFIFEVVLNGSALFNHANMKLPLFLDKIIRAVFVTPDMHRVHHSVIREETDSNYGFNLSVWDRMFGSYTDQPREGHGKMEIGLPQYRDGSPRFMGWSLLFPFKGKDQ